MNKSRLLLFCLSLLIWIILTLPFDWQNFFVGVVASFVVALLTGDMFTRRPHLFFHPQRYLWFFVYIPVFLWECLKANIDVALRVLHPKCPLKPGIVKVKTTLKSDTAITFLANSITLTPGTLTVDVDKQRGILYVHWIRIKTQDIEEATKIIVYRFERILRRIFEE